MSSDRLVALLAEHSGRDLGAPPDLTSALHELVARARAAWPSITATDDAFVKHLARHLPDGADLAQAVAKLHAADLFLACGCAAGDGEAIATFDREFMSRVPAVIARVERAQSNIEELVQSVRVGVLTGDPPRIVQYSGRGPLHGWLRTVAVNAALMARRQRREVLQSAGGLAKRAVEGQLDPETRFVRERHREQFQAALDGALQSLTARERTLLRAYFVDDLNIDELAATFQVHRATAARWLQTVHQRLLDETRARVMAQVKLTASEFDSLAAMLKSDLSLTFSKLPVQ